MNLNDKKQLTTYVAGVLKYYRVDSSEFTLTLWANAMDKYEVAAVCDAFGRYVQNPDVGQFPPKIADIVKALQGSTVDTSVLAWAKVEKAIARVGGYQTAVFDDAVIHAAIDRMGGWVKMSMIVNDELPFKRNEFLAQYKAVKSLPRFDYPPSLMGLHDLENVGKGYKQKTPVMIGNETACMAVLDGGSDTSLKISHVGSAANEVAKRLAA